LIKIIIWCNSKLLVKTDQFIVSLTALSCDLEFSITCCCLDP
jgi:hypothetical protein